MRMSEIERGALSEEFLTRSKSLLYFVSVRKPWGKPRARE